MADDKTAVSEVMTAFEEFKKANDERLKEIEKKGGADVVLTEKVDRINAAMDKFEQDNQKRTAEALEERKKLESALEDEKKHVDEIEEKLSKLSLRAPSGEDAKIESKKRHDMWARSVVNAHTKGVANLTEDERKVFNEVAAEYKALSVGNDTTGGYLAPVEYVREIIKGVTEVSPVRSLVRIRQTANKSIEIPKRTGQFAAQWVAENGNRSETEGLTYGMWEIPTHELYALIDISEQNLEDSAFDMEGEIRMESQEQFAVAEGTAVVSGNGVGKPEGWMTAGGVSETVSGSATTIADADGQANGLLTLKHALKTAYTRNAAWVLNRTTLGSLRKLKTSDKQYLWMPGIAQGKPNTIDGDPYVEVPDMPSEGSNTYPIAYGDFRRAYTLVDRIQMSMLRDPYTQATSGNIRFIMRKRLGGQVVLAEAIRKLKCST